jgi:transposase
LHRAGFKFSEIEKETGVKANTAGRIWSRQNNGYNCKSAPCNGRPPKLDENARENLRDYILKDRHTRREPLHDISNILNLHVHPDTIHKVLVEMGLGHRIERKRPWLSPKQKAARLKFAQEHVHWAKQDWRYVEFSDEMGLQTGANEGNIYVWRYPEEEYKEDCCAATHKSGFKKIKVWGSMRYGSLSNLVVLLEKKGDGKFNAREYVDVIMDRELFDRWAKGMEELGDIMIMEDGAGYHQGVATQRRKQYQQDGWQGWGPGTWPANSPDLNPLENLWHLLRTNVKKRDPKPMRKEDLIEALKEEWEKLDIKKVNALIDSMPRRMKAVINAEGGTTHY